MDSARDQFAGKEMEIGRYYMERRDFTGAINRLKIRRDPVSEHAACRRSAGAADRAYMAIGIVDEAQTAAACLVTISLKRWYKDAYIW